MSSVMEESTASPLRVAGWKRHCLTAEMAAYHFEEPVAPRGFLCPIAIGLQP